MKKRYSKEYYKMMKKYRKEARAIAKDSAPWDWCWSIDFLINHLKWMKEYYIIGENVYSKEDKEWKQDEKYTRLEMIDQILNAYNEFEDYSFNFTGWETMTEEEKQNRRDLENKRYYDLRHNFYSLLEQYMSKLWD